MRIERGAIGACCVAVLMSAAVVERLNTAIVRIVNESAMSKYLSDQGTDHQTMTLAEYAAYTRAEVVKWAKVVKALGAKVD